MRRNGHHAIFNIRMLALVRNGGDALGIVLEFLRQLRNLRWHGGRKHQRAALFWRGIENKFEIFAKAQIQHFVRFIQHNGLQCFKVQRATSDMVAQTPRRADNNMGALLQRAHFLAHLHAANAGRHFGASTGIKPFQFAGHLQRQFARRRHNQRHWLQRHAQPLFALKQALGNRHAKRHRLTGAGLRRNQQIRRAGVFIQHGALNGG